jgi:hypothetical protein
MPSTSFLSSLFIAFIGEFCLNENVNILIDTLLIIGKEQKPSPFFLIKKCGHVVGDFEGSQQD